MIEYLFQQLKQILLTLRLKPKDVAIATQIGNIWINSGERPFWTGGWNAGPHLTDEELDKNNLSGFKIYPFDEIWAESVRLGKIKRGENA